MSDEDTNKPAEEPGAKATGPDDGLSDDAASEPTSKEASDQVDPRLLELLVCPLTKTRLQYDAERNELVSKAAGLAFPIKNGVPLMIEEAARPLDD
ncbi:MAG: Trm112 family protein [Filomicrobium sp.]